MNFFGARIDVVKSWFNGIDPLAESFFESDLSLTNHLVGVWAPTAAARKP